MRIVLVSDNGTVIESWTLVPGTDTDDDDDAWVLGEELWSDIRRTVILRDETGGLGE